MQSEISQRKTNTVWYHLSEESEQSNKLVNVTKRQHTHRRTKELLVVSGEKKGVRGKTGERLGVQTILYNVIYKDILYNVGNVANILQ